MQDQSESDERNFFADWQGHERASGSGYNWQEVALLVITIINIIIVVAAYR